MAAFRRAGASSYASAAASSSCRVSSSTPGSVSRSCITVMVPCYLIGSRSGTLNLVRESDQRHHLGKGRHRVAVSKRLRYEVFRRDNHACRYCGATAPDVKLTIDHVVPKALGGSDTDPANLVTACEPCNAGKTSTNPDAPLVADVAQDALRWAKALTQSAEVMLAEQDRFS